MKYAEIDRCSDFSNKVYVWRTSKKEIRSSGKMTRVVMVEDHIIKGSVMWGDEASSKKSVG